MKATITNKITVIENPSDELKLFLNKELSYVDKAKKYQLTRMSRNPFTKNSALFKKLQAESEGNLLKVHPSGNYLVIPSALLYLLNNFTISTIDKRSTTGITVPLPWVNKPHDLRDYQQEAADLMDSNYRGIINFATGLGKTLLATHSIKRHRTKTLVVCPTDSVAKQFYKELVSAFGEVKVGFFGDGKKKIKDITVGIAASVYKNVDLFKKENLGLIIIDEAHHIPASTFYNIATELGDVGKIFGLTATDYRSDGKDIMISAGCGDVLISKDIKWGVANGWLAEPIFIIREVKTGGKDFRDDKLKNYIEHVRNSSIMKDQILNDIKAFISKGKSVLCLVDEVAHGEELSKLLGIPFATGKDSKSQEYVDQLNAGKIPGLIGTDGKVGEGTDTKNVDVLVMANFVASKGPVIQGVGRGLRKQGQKTHCIILDYIPVSSKMLERHALNRIKFYKEITDKVTII
jgi:ATP-dependent helicase IRC3